MDSPLTEIPVDSIMETTIQSLQEGISVLNRDLDICYVNPKMNQWYSQNSPLVGKKCYQAYHNCSEPCEKCPTLRSFKTGEIEKK